MSALIMMILALALRVLIAVILSTEVLCRARNWGATCILRYSASLKASWIWGSRISVGGHQVLLREKEDWTDLGFPRKKVWSSRRRLKSLRSLDRVRLQDLEFVLGMNFRPLLRIWDCVSVSKVSVRLKIGWFRAPLIRLAVGLVLGLEIGWGRGSG